MKHRADAKRSSNEQGLTGDRNMTLREEWHTLIRLAAVMYSSVAVLALLAYAFIPIP